MLQCAQSASCKEAGSSAEPFDALDVNAGRGGNALIEEKILSAPYTRIVINLRQSKLSNCSHTFSATERGTLERRGHWPAAGEARSACSRYLYILRVGDHFDCG